MARKSRKGTLETPVPCGMKLWRAALYIRLSVEFNGRRGDSLETQREIMEAHLALYPDIEIVDLYIDNGISGRTFERDAFQRMLADIEARKINCVVVKDLSRLGRSTIDTGYYIEKYFPVHQVRFIAVNDQYDSERADNSGSHITVPLKNMINEAYAADISKKVRSQAHQSMKSGEFIGGRPPYGYRKDPDNCHKLLPDENTAPVVRQIFTWAADSVPLNQMVKRLNEAGVLTPSHYKASCGLIKHENLMGSGAWQTMTVSKILADAVYTGDMVQGKTTIIGHRQVPTPPEDWIVVRGTHEALVSRELFAQAQAARERAASRHARTAKVPYTENLLRRRVFCGCCGKPLHRERHGGNYFYRCISNDRIKKDACPRSVSVREDRLFQTILTIIRKEAEVVMGNSLRLQQSGGKLEQDKAEISREISKLRQSAADSRKYLTGLYENFVSGILTAEEYHTMKANYEGTIATAAQRVRELQYQQAERTAQVADYISMADRLAGISKDSKLSALLVEQLIERITVNGPEDIVIQFRFESGFERVAEVLADE